jgi:hypothetical protein
MRLRLSPVGKALLGRRVGEQVEVQTPSGLLLLTVVDIADSAAPVAPRDPWTRGQG